MPTRTDIRSWPQHRADYWAGEKGGRPLPKRAPHMRKGDRGPKELKLGLSKAFYKHEEAVEYARAFGKHVQIETRIRYDRDDNPRKVFIVNPKRGKLQRRIDDDGEITHIATPIR